MTRLPPEDFDEFIRVRSPALLRSAWLLTGDAGRAEDLLQTALARVWPRWAKVVAGTSPDTYVRRVLYTTYLSWYRRRWRFEVPTGASGEPADRSDVAGEAAQRDAVRRALAALSRQQRASCARRREPVQRAMAASRSKHATCPRRRDASPVAMRTARRRD